MTQRVLHVTFDMRIGGTEQVIRNLIEASDTQRYAMSIYCIEEPIGPFGEMLQENGVAITCTARQPGLDFKVIHQLRKHIREQHIDVVHCHQYTPWVYGALASIGLGKRVIFTEHGRFYPDSSSWKRRLVNPVLAAITDRITAISKATRQALIDYEFISAARVEVIYNGIEPLMSDVAAAQQIRQQFGISQDAIVLGTIARFDPIKNHAMMLRAFKIVNDQHPDTRLLIVGDGEERPAIEARIRELELAHAVILSGYVSRPAPLLETMDIFLLSSFSEGTSMTLLEAMSLGKPCVVTAVGGNPEIIEDGETGHVTPNDNPERFAQAIVELLPPTHRDAVHTVAMDRFRSRFTNAIMAGHYEQVYRPDAHQ